MRSRRHPVGLSVGHQRVKDGGVHLRSQVLTREDRGDAADHAVARVGLERFAGERLPDVGRVVPLQPLCQRDDRVGAGAATDSAVDRVHARIRVTEGGEQDAERLRLGTGGPPGHDLEPTGANRGAGGLVAAARAERQREGQDGDGREAADHGTPPASPVAGAGSAGPPSRAAAPAIMLGRAPRSYSAYSPTTAKQAAGTTNEIAGLVASSELALHQWHDRAAHDRHYEAGSPELRRRSEPLQSDAVNRREHQGQAEGHRNERDHPGQIRTQHRERAQQHGEEGEHRHHLGGADATDDPGHQEPRHEEDQQAELQVDCALLEAPAQGLTHVQDQVGPGAHLGPHVRELGDDAEAVAPIPPEDTE